MTTNILPRDYQTNIIEKSINYFRKNNNGILVLPCGVGKTLISLWISKYMNCKKILIGVPNILLLNQWKKSVKKIFNKIKILTICQNKENVNIDNFLQNNEKCIIITTYSSSYKMLEECKKIKYEFDIKINDEMHHLTSNNYKYDEKTKNFIEILKIKSKKQLSLTATLKIVENKKNNIEENIIISNDNKEIFGNIIERKSLLWAIDNNIICDYKIQVLTTDKDEMDDILKKFNIDDNDKNLFLSAYSALKSIKDNFTHHLLIYCNNQEKSNKINNYIKNLLEKKYFEIDDLYYSNYHSKLQKNTRINILDKFEKSTKGIIINVYCLGEGVDLPFIDGVVFGEKMGSNIRIVQSALRASRKNINEQNKITKIILPILDNDDENEYKKVIDIIYQLGTEDKTIETKISVSNITIPENKINANNINNNDLYELGEYNEDLSKELQLRTLSRLMKLNNISYEKAKEIIKNKKLKSIDEYKELCKKDYRLPKEPNEYFLKKFKGWIDYLNIDKNQYYDLETCKNKINYYINEKFKFKKNNLDLIYINKELCKIDKKIPNIDLILELYNLKNLSEIIIIKKTKKEKIIL